ncbi:hypothetical protein H6G74_15500 [Nostoc spongiaeforme FACHB-130]|uniref:Uncharacterized protein n=1 Tax=Nostoc spongiaeforme FACHB-130 TaxID=1357510 RepID=A0ABR8FZ77_9NOSO|nr:hypothetical protein [Nostoc spongiaeforme]MBD2595722.1 hypothetical protein [Nostoc spongiaeforme FACHB-130]
MFTIVTTDGLEVEIDMQDIDYVEVADDDLTDDDYTDASQYNIVMESGEEYLVNVLDNLGVLELLWDMFVTM